MQELLDEFGLPDDAPDRQVQGLTRVAAMVCGTPTSVVNLLGARFQHQIGAVGFEGGRSDVNDSMCTLSVRRPELRHVPDARLEPAFVQLPWVDGRLARVRFYAAEPLVLPDGRTFGTLCVFSGEPHSLRPDQRAALRDLAAQVVALFEQRRLLRRAELLAAELQASERTLRLVAEGSSDVVALLGQDARVRWVSPSVEPVLGFPRERATGSEPAERVHPADQSALADALRTTFRLADTAEVRLQIEDASGEWRSLDCTLTPQVDDDGIVRLLHVLARDRR